MKKKLLYALILLMAPALVSAKTVTCTTKTNFVEGQDPYPGASVTCTDGEISLTCKMENANGVRNGVMKLKPFSIWGSNAQEVNYGNMTDEDEVKLGEKYAFLFYLAYPFEDGDKLIVDGIDNTDMAVLCKEYSEDDDGCPLLGAERNPKPAPVTSPSASPSTSATPSASTTPSASSSTSATPSASTTPSSTPATSTTPSSSIKPTTQPSSSPSTSTDPNKSTDPIESSVPSVVDTKKDDASNDTSLEEVTTIGANAKDNIDDSKLNNSKNNNNMLLLAGIIAGIIAAIVLVIFFIILGKKKKEKEEKKEENLTKKEK